MNYVYMQIKSAFWVFFLPQSSWRLLVFQFLGRIYGNILSPHNVVMICLFDNALISQFMAFKYLIENLHNSWGSMGCSQLKPHACENSENCKHKIHKEQNQQLNVSDFVCVSIQHKLCLYCVFTLCSLIRYNKITSQGFTKALQV